MAVLYCFVEPGIVLVCRFRFYSPTEAFFDKSRKLPDFEKVR